MSKPNVLIIHCDQLRRDGLSSLGSDYAETPHIDALAAAGTTYHRHYVANTVCSPSRASLMTGLHASAHGLWGNGCHLPRRDHVPGPLGWLSDHGKHTTTLQPPTLADTFAAAGYRTAAFGKMHLQPLLCFEDHGFHEPIPMWRGGAQDDWNGPYFGFEHVELCMGHHEKQQTQAGHYAMWLRDRSPASIAAVEDAEFTAPHQMWDGPIAAEYHHTNWLAERSTAWVDGLGDDEPFCAFVGFPGPHHPFSPSFDVWPDFAQRDVGVGGDAEGRFLSASEGHARFFRDPPMVDLRAEPAQLVEARRRTAAMIHQIDQAVGRIVDQLKRSGRWQNTIVVFTSDHGDYLGEHGCLFKGSLASRSLLEVPLLISGPGMKAGGHDREAISSVDLLPSLAALAGVETPKWLHGIDRSQPGSGVGHCAFAWCYDAVLHDVERRADNISAVDGQYRYTVYPRAGCRELFAHDDDPHETRNLVEEHSGHAVDLHARLSEAHLAWSLPVSERYGPF